MNKMLTLIFAALLSGTALAETGISTEFERERGTQSPNTMTNTIKIAPYVKFDNGVKADIQVGASRAVSYTHLTLPTKRIV